MKKTLLLSFAFAISTLGFAQLDSITNPGFENWSSLTTPIGWTTVYASKATGGNAYSGTSLNLTTTGSTAGTATTTATFRMRPDSITYFCKYSPVGGDAPLIQIAFTKTIGTSTYTVATASSNTAGAVYGRQSLAVNYVKKYHAYSPDKVTISIASSGTSPASGSALYFDNLAFVYSYNLSSNIVPSGYAPSSYPADGATIPGAVAGQLFSFHTTNYIPDTIKLNLPFAGTTFTITSEVDSLLSGSYELSGSAANFMTVDTNATFENMTSRNSINSISFSGIIPPSPANATYILVVTPIMWGKSSVAPLANFPSPQTNTYYIKVGNGGDTITSTDNIYWGSIQSGGVKRLYNVYVPSIYRTAHKRVPLLFNIHGWTGSPTKQMDFENFRPVADTANFIVVQPLATGTVPSWISGPGTTDTDFLFALLDTLEAKYNIDTDRVYCTGFSEGGMMCYTFACSYSNRIAAVASVAGGLSSTSTCAPTHFMPIMETHGTNDPLASYSSVQALLNYWVGVNKIDTIANSVVRTNLTDITTADSSTVQHWVYNNPKACGATIEHYKILNGGHECPTLNAHAKNNYGLNARNNDYEAVKEMWRFLSKYRLSELCAPTAVNEISAQNDVTHIYPNPSNGKFIVELVNYKSAKLKITGLAGNVVFETTIEKQYTNIDLSNVAKGMYIYQIITSTGSVSSGKIMIE